MSRTVIAPIIGFVVILLKMFGIEVPEDVANGVADWVVTGLSLGFIVYGIVKNHKTGNPVE